MAKPKPTGIHRRSPITLTPSFISRFQSRVEKKSPEECWPWTASFRNGYGAIKHEGRVLSAHRVAYVLINGVPDEGLVIGHKCDNKACCNPEHLEAITHRRNVQDAHARLEVQLAKGEHAHNAVLTEATVRMARIAHKGGMKTAELAEVLGVSRRTISKAIRRETWAHV